MLSLDRSGKPIYDLKPQAGDYAFTLTKATLQLLPIVGGFLAELFSLFPSPQEKQRDAIFMLLAEKLATVPKDHLIAPDLLIAGPASEDLRYASNDPDLREMYTNLLTKTMNQSTAGSVQRSFVDILRRINPVEAQFLDIFNSWTAVEFQQVLDSASYPLVFEEAFIVAPDRIITGSTHHLPTTKLEADAFGESLIHYGLVTKTKTDALMVPNGVAGETAIYDAMRRVIERGGKPLGVTFDFELTAFGKVFLIACSRTSPY